MTIRARRANLPSAKQTEKDCYTLEEAQNFIDVLLEKAPIVYQCYFLLAIYGGFRRAELCGLTWGNIDFDDQVVSVRKTLNYICRQGLQINTTKTSKSTRSLKLPAEIFVHLHKLQNFYANEETRLLDSWQSSEFVFKTADSSPLSPQAPLSWLKWFCDRENLRHVNIHSVRHSHTSVLINEGINIKEIARSLGHSDVEVTWNTYAHLYPREEDRAVNILNKIV